MKNRIPRLLAAALIAVLPACTTLKDDAGFEAVKAAPVPGVPHGFSFDASRLTAAQCTAWLDQTLPAHIWHGEEKDFVLIHGRVVFGGGMCRQYRTFSSPEIRTYHLREIPLVSVKPTSFSPVKANLNAPAADRNYSFDVAGAWTRKWESWSVPDNKITARGSVSADSVTFYFTSRAAATRARDVMIRLATLTQAARS